MTNEYQSNGSCLEIDTLGRFAVKRNQLILTEEVRSSKKIWTLFMYLLTYRKKSLLPEVIVDHLWPEANYENPRGLLRTQMHRLRKLMDSTVAEDGTCVICYNNGAYYWNPDVKYKIDADLFESLSEEARTKSVSDPQGAVQLYMEALEWYQGDYLPECAGEDWVIPAKVHYRRIFITDVMEICRLLTELQQYDNVFHVCEKAMLLEPSEESIHLIFLETLLKTEKIKEAVHHYQYVTSLHYRDLGITPSASMKKLYQQIVALQTEELPLPVHPNNKSPENAFYCHPTVFESICQLEERKSERNGTSSHLCLFTWSLNNSDHKISGIERIEIGIKNHLLHHLRRSDVLTRWSDRRFVALFTGLTRIQADQLVVRMTARFDEQKEALGIRMIITIQDHLQDPIEEYE